jgi:hypothetical protein
VSTQASSLREIDHVADVISRLRLDEAARTSGALIVEGSADQRALQSAFDELQLTFFPVGGRNNVLSIADRLAESYLPGVVCIADADFDHEVSDRSDQWFLVFTDNGDLDAMLFFSPALHRVLETWANEQKLRDLGGTSGLRQRICEEARVVAVLRAANAKKRLGLPFDAVDLQDIVPIRTFKVNVAGLLDRLAMLSGKPRNVVEEAASERCPLCAQTGEPLLNGGDCLAMVGIALRRLVGSLSKQQIADKFAERSTRLALRPGDLDETPFAARLERALAQSLS